MNIKDRILVQTLKLFLSQGIKATNMDDVASSLGISKKTLYAHVDNKLDLVNQCFYLHIQNVEGVLNESVSQT